MSRVKDHQPALFPIGDMQPPDAPADTAVGSLDDDDPWEAIIAAWAWVMIRTYGKARTTQEDPSELS